MFVLILIKSSQVLPKKSRGLQRLKRKNLITKYFEVIFMKIMNKKLKHVQFGEGEVIGQESQKISVQFSEQYGTKQFVYPDAFGKFLKLNDAKLEVAVLEELNNKQEQIRDEKERVQKEYEETKAAEKLKLEGEKKKVTRKPKVK